MRPSVRGIAAALLFAAVWGCKRKDADAAPTPSGPFTVVLVVENQGYFDVNVYLMRAPDATGRRLGTVGGNSARTFQFRDTELQPGVRLQVSARAIGSRISWTSPSVAVGPGNVARLQLLSNPGGDLSRSQFYVEAGSGPP